MGSLESGTCYKNHKVNKPSGTGARRPTADATAIATSDIISKDHTMIQGPQS